mmetsp:Transcript_1839/g.3617  ORF Transcript_1839/g.3617 Transcript_1839/m.3617 type:complete len:247 (+) Transcript_1839:454-1194(+)
MAMKSPHSVRREAVARGRRPRSPACAQTVLTWSRRPPAGAQVSELCRSKAQRRPRASTQHVTETQASAGVCRSRRTCCISRWMEPVRWRTSSRAKSFSVCHAQSAATPIEPRASAAPATPPPGSVPGQASSSAPALLPPPVTARGPSAAPDPSSAPPSTDAELPLLSCGSMPSSASAGALGGGLPLNPRALERTAPPTAAAASALPRVGIRVRVVPGAREGRRAVASATLPTPRPASNAGRGDWRV